MTTDDLMEYRSSDEVERARMLQAQGNLQEAENIYLHQLNVTPEDPFLLFFLGTLYMQRQMNGLATTILIRAVQLRQDIPEIYNNLGTALKAMGRYYEAEMAFLKAVDIRRDPDFLNNMATVNINNGTPEEAERYCRECLTKQPNHHQSAWNLALALLEQGRWEEGWSYYDKGFFTAGRRDRQYNCAEWDGGPTERLVVYGEQGLGDEIMFSTMIPDLPLRGVEHLILDCHPRLAKLFRRSYEGCFKGKLIVYPDRKSQKMPGWVYDHQPTAKVAMGSLGRHLRPDAASFRKQPDTPLKADGALVDAYAVRMQDNGYIHIGLSWEGGTVKTNADWRSMRLEDLVPLVREFQDRVRFYSLQYTPGAAEEVRQINERYGLNILHDQEMVDDYERTAALVTCLDLVLSVCTAVVHLAGALGVPTWCMTPARAAWRYQLTGDRMIWYPNYVRLYRQPDRDNPSWEPVLERVHDDLRAYVAVYGEGACLADQ